MKRRTPTFALLVLLPTALLSACAVPLGPGYTVKKQQLEARWTGTPELAVRGTYRLQNTGKAPLDYIEVTLPPESRRSGLQVTLDNSPVAPQPADKLAPAGTVRIPISPPLPLKKKRDLAIEYRLAGAFGDALDWTTFYLQSRGWYPDLREREGLFGSGGEPPEKWDLRVTVPRDFLVHASGQPKGRKRRGDTLEHRFRQRTGQDFDPYVMAGQMSEFRVESGGNELVLWSKEPLAQERARRTLEQLGQIVQGMQKAFGSLGEEGGDSLLFAQGGVATSSGQNEHVTFPGAVWVNSPLVDESDSSCVLDGTLARLWFFHSARPEAAAEGLAWALADHAPVLAPGGCEHSVPALNQASFVPQTLRRYEQSREAYERQPDENTRMWMEYEKQQLFVVALEERLGRERLNSSLRRMLQALRGQTWTTNDLRVAIQLETGEDPADFFRQWLNQPGIPEEFRKRYEKPREGNRE